MQSKKANFYESKYSIQIDKGKRSQSYGFQCFTPILSKNKTVQQSEERSMRLSDRIHSINEQFHNQNQNQSNKNWTYNEQNINYSRDITWKQLNNSKINVKSKDSFQKQRTILTNNSNNNTNNNNIDGFLIIRSNDQQLPDQYPQNLQEIRLLLAKVKNQNKILKDQNFKLRLQKVKQSSNTQILKTINLKSEVQKIKNRILNLLQEKNVIEKRKQQIKKQQNHIKQVDQTKQAESPKYIQTNNRGKLTQYDHYEPILGNTKNQYNMTNSIYQKSNFNSKNINFQNSKKNYTYQQKIKIKQDSPNKQESFKYIKQSPTKESIKRQQYYPKFINKKYSTLFGSGEMQKK